MKGSKQMDSQFKLKKKLYLKEIFSLKIKMDHKE